MRQIQVAIDDQRLPEVRRPHVPERGLCHRRHGRPRADSGVACGQATLKVGRGGLGGFILWIPHINS